MPRSEENQVYLPLQKERKQEAERFANVFLSAREDFVFSNQVPIQEQKKKSYQQGCVLDMGTWASVSEAVTAKDGGEGGGQSRTLIHSWEGAQWSDCR